MPDIPSNLESHLMHYKQISCDKGLVKLDPYKNLLIIRGREPILLTRTQSMLVHALLSGHTQKAEIIRIIWGDRAEGNVGNKYHQLVYQVRSVLRKNNFPDALIITLHRQGIKFNTSVLIPHQ